MVLLQCHCEDCVDQKILQSVSLQTQRTEISILGLFLTHKLQSHHSCKLQIYGHILAFLSSQARPKIALLQHQLCSFLIVELPFLQRGLSTILNQQWKSFCQDQLLIQNASYSSKCLPHKKLCRKQACIIVDKSRPKLRNQDQIALLNY